MRLLWVGMIVCMASGCRASSMEHWMTGQLELQMGSTEAAVASLERCKRDQPDFAPAYLALAAAKSKQGDFQAVAQNLVIYLRLEPQHHVANMYYAECMMTLGRFAEAEDYFNKYLATVNEPETGHRSRLAHAHSRLAELSKNRSNPRDQQFHESIAAFHRAKESREKSRLIADMAQAAAAKQQADGLITEAKQKLEQVRNERPNDPRVRKYLSELAKPTTPATESKEAGVVTARKPESIPTSSWSTNCFFPNLPQPITTPKTPVSEQISTP